MVGSSKAAAVDGGNKSTTRCCVRKKSLARRSGSPASEDEVYAMRPPSETSTTTSLPVPAELLGVGWLARGDRQPSEKRVPFNRPTPKQVMEALPFVRRYFVYWMKHTFDKEKLFINTFQPLKHKPFYGVPCGGIGCGAIGRDFRGGFCKFSLRPGLVEHKVDVVPADQFILSVREGGVCVYQKVLCAADVILPSGQLAVWDFSFPKNHVHYRGLYPRSWTCYLIPELGLTVVIRQISPVLPNNYEDSSLPVCVFVVDADNASGRDYDVSVAFTFRNGTGNRRWERESECSAVKFHASGTADAPKVEGVMLYNSIANMDCRFGLATTLRDDVKTTICQRFDPSKSGAGVWSTLFQTGDFAQVDDNCAHNSREMAVGVCNRFRLHRRTKREVDFALSWDMPRVSFGSSARVYHRRYTRFFRKLDLAVADELCVRALRSRNAWERAINGWQSPVVTHPRLPNWYKSALFNELYFITDGGSVWFEYDDGWASKETHLSEYTRDLMRVHGRFGYLESWEYRMVNTYDVHFYASYALAELWPQLELAIQAEFRAFWNAKNPGIAADQVYHAVDTQIKFHMEGDWASLKTAARVPHDLGNPADDPWVATNAYVMHDTGKWKDLNMKYVLTSWRDYVALTSRQHKFLCHTWPAVKNIMLEALQSWDKDHDGMIENFGKADQTYDAWQMEGVSAYCGSLWLASLRVASQMASEMGEYDTANLLAETLTRARQVFIDELWTGEYFRFCQRSRSRETVMADQLCGYWFLQSVSPELAIDLLPEVMVRKALATIYELNVCRFGNGQMGAVNGMRPDGRVDREYIQADEMWTGVTYAVAAFLIQQGEVQKAFHTASGCYNACFERAGLQYQTPEAIYETKFYRAIGYMRPLAVWAMQWALKRHCRLHTPFENLYDLPLNTTASTPTLTALGGPSTSSMTGRDVAGGNAASEDSASLGYVSDFRDDRDDVQFVAVAVAAANSNL